MFSRKCPRCGSDKVRLGYRRSPWLLRLFGIHNLLCDHCNWLFTGIGIPWIGPRKAKRRN